MPPLSTSCLPSISQTCTCTNMEIWGGGGGGGGENVVVIVGTFISYHLGLWYPLLLKPIYNWCVYVFVNSHWCLPSSTPHCSCPRFLMSRGRGVNVMPISLCGMWVVVKSTTSCFHVNSISHFTINFLIYRIGIAGIAQILAPL